MRVADLEDLLDGAYMDDDDDGWSMRWRPCHTYPRPDRQRWFEQLNPAPKENP